ncbi:MAG: response regulator [Gammaproteobacteria bacterium]|nr:response regulator [Gammaproteobacteria bacterium]
MQTYNLKQDEKLSILDNKTRILLHILKVAQSRVKIGVHAPADLTIKRAEHYKTKPTPLSRTAVDHHTKSGRLLFVEDSELLQKVFKIFTQELHYNNADFATTGKQALNLIKRNRYSLIFLDINLPDISGIDICKNIRAKNSGKKIPIIAVTSDEDYEPECRAAGVNDFIVKPLLMDKLQNLVERWT